MGSVQRVVSSATLLLDAHNALLREMLEMSGDTRCIHFATLAQAHRILGRLTVTQPAHQREAVDFAQGLQKLRKFLNLYILHSQLLSHICATMQIYEPKQIEIDVSICNSIAIVTQNICRLGLPCRRMPHVSPRDRAAAKRTQNEIKNGP